MPNEVEHKALTSYLDEHKLKRTRQREVILDVFLSTSGHITAEELLRRVRERYPKIGYTTIYRTMKILCDAGLADTHHFDGDSACYEVKHQHHDHLVCVRCGKIVEFECAMIEDAQERIVQRYGFRLLRHRHELYGHCAACREGAPE